MTDLHELESGGHTHAHAFDSKAVHKEIWRITLYLSILTIVELALGFIMMNWPEESFKRHFVKGVVLILMFWKAYYIIAFFMHLKHEVRNMIMVIGIPATLFVWFVIAFIADGSSYKHLRQRYDPYQIELSHLPMPIKDEPGKTHEIKPTEKPKTPQQE